MKLDPELDKGISCQRSPVSFGALAPETVSTKWIQGFGGVALNFVLVVFDNFLIILRQTVFNPWFSNSGFGIMISEVGKDLILHCKHSI